VHVPWGELPVVEQRSVAERAIQHADAVLSGCGFALACLAVTMAPWLFGAWEMWWFWPFAVCIFASALCFGLRLILAALTGDSSGVACCLGGRSRLLVLLVLSGLPFLVYAFVRFLQAAVFMDAQRSFLLFFLPFLLGVQVLFGFSRRQRDLLYVLLLADLLALGAYGLANHAITGSEYVMWAPSYSLYVESHRASGSLFCPNHFSGIMEVAFGLGLALLLDRARVRGWRAFGFLLMGVAAAGVLLSKSRGGGMAVVAVCAAAMVLAFGQWPPVVRWRWRALASAIFALVVTVLACTENSYKRRFKAYFRWQGNEAETMVEAGQRVKRHLLATSRGRMISAALRAWRTSPTVGIGPGMHQNLWPHFAPTPDGDRARGLWPEQLNNDFHSYEVHSDWVQLLEEYGEVGFVLFLFPFALVFLFLKSGVTRAKWRGGHSPGLFPSLPVAIPLGALFGFVAMAAHSVADFNLQIPATTWMIGSLICLGVASVADGADAPTASGRAGGDERRG